MKIDPTLDKSAVEKIVIRKMKEKMTDPTIIMDNNVTGDGATITLTELCGWIEKRNPVISGNATFYEQPSILQSPTSNMLRSLKKGRKQIKSEMFKYKPEDDEYQQLDLAQLNAKVIMNAEYGASGAPTAAFYTKYSPAATTLMAQSIITTMAAFFEGYVGDNQKFFHINECFDWMNIICRKKEKVPKWVVIPNHWEVAQRIKSHFFMSNPDDFFSIEAYLSNCSDAELAYIYYANNMKSFISNHHKVSTLIKNILSSLPLYEAAIDEVPPEFQSKFPPEPKGKHVEKYNKWVSNEMFLNPYKIPPVIEPYMKELTELLTQFVYVEYVTPDSIVKLNNHLRNTVLLVDTDSNVINADIFVSYVLNDLLPGETFYRRKLYNEMICVNILAAVLDHCVIKILDFYGRIHHMDENSRKELTMKNEFMFRKFFLMLTKKRYATSIALREGNIIMPFKLEIKGLDFIKAGVTEEVTKRFTKMLSEHILFSDDLELHELMKDLKMFEREIYHDLKSGGVKYLKPQMFKSEGAYKKIKDDNGIEIGNRAWSLPVFRGAAIWNELYPKQKIYSLDRVKIVKLIVTSPTDLERIKVKYPNDYDDIMKKVFMSPSADIQKAGLKVIAIPSTVPQIPGWIVDLIDYDVIISDVVSSFRSVLDALKLEGMNIKTPNGKANITSSLISL